MILTSSGVREKSDFDRLLAMNSLREFFFSFLELFK